MKSIEQMVDKPESIELISKAMAIFMKELNSYLNTLEDINPHILQSFLPQIIDTYFNYLLSLPTTNIDLEVIKQAFLQQNFLKVLEDMPVTSKMH